MKLVDTVNVNNTLGEGVIWDHRINKIWWTDIEKHQLYRYDPVTQQLEQWQTPERLACFAPVENGTGLAAAFESGFAFYDPQNSALKWIARLETDNPATRFNDGRTDRQGRLWAGTMVEGDNPPYLGSLYCLNSDLSINKIIGGLSIPNSLCWSPDGNVMYHTDTPTQTIQQYGYQTSNGHIGQPQPFTNTDDGCFPDGSIVDADGYLWNAQWGGSQVVRYTPSGQQDLVVKVPTKQPSCVAFGGKNLNLLIVTSAHQDMSAEQRANDQQAGNLFIYETEYTGLIERGFVQT